MAAGILNGIGITILGNALNGVPALDPWAEMDVLRSPEAEAHVSHQRAGVDAMGCVLYKLRWIEDGRLLHVWTGQFRRLETGGWTRDTAPNCVKEAGEGRTSP